MLVADSMASGKAKDPLDALQVLINDVVSCCHSVNFQIMSTDPHIQACPNWKSVACIAKG